MRREGGWGEREGGERGRVGREGGRKLTRHAMQ